MLSPLVIAAIVGGIGVVGAVGFLIAALRAKGLEKAKLCFRAILFFLVLVLGSVLGSIWYCATVLV